jgi:hypothetical protein
MRSAAAPRHRPTAATILALTVAAIAGSLVPALVGLVFLISLAVHRPLVAAAADRWPWLSGGRAGAEPARDRRAFNRLTAVWGIAMLIAGAIQGVGALRGRLTITDAAGLATRALIALAIEAALVAVTVAYLRRGPAPDQVG